MYNTDAYNTRKFNESPNLTRSESDSVSLADSMSFLSAFVRTLTESVSLSDSISRTVAFSRTLFDNINVADALINKTFNKLKQAPRIFAAFAKRRIIGSATQVRPERI